MRVVVDADVLIGALDASDAHHAEVRALFSLWRGRDDSTFVSVVNLSEVLVAPAADRERLRAAREAIAALGVAVHQAGEAIGVDAARLRRRHPISLRDAYCLATARHVRGAVASFDDRLLRAGHAEGITAVETTSS